MRIQHNIPAMSAYRNYTNNTSAVSKNLERLSSGYRINRAGDDAAGLAISEKMRAQITGLNAAQKNAKDGISLVKTAEGALQEVHDMLNRMVSLATQSANGTYDNDVDRAQLQKEVNQLRTEINRIADSSNFNGIKLFDGTMEASGESTYEFLGGTPLGISGTAITDPTQLDNTKTLVHTTSKDASKTTFEVELENISFATKGNGTGKVGIEVGGAKISVAFGTAGGTATTELGGSTLAQKLAGVGGGKVKIGGVTYGMKAEGTKLVFTMEDDSLKNVTKAASFNGNFAITVIKDGTNAQQSSGSVNLASQVIKEGNPKVNGNLANASATGWTGLIKDLGALKVGDTTYVFTTKADSAKLVEKAGANFVNVDLSDLVDKTGALSDTVAQGLGYDTYLNAAAARLTVAAKDNKMFTVGVSGNNSPITFQEKSGYNGDGKNGRADLTTVDGIKAQLQSGTLGEVKHAAAKGDGTGLLLQIGDTAEDFNQLKVSLGDMHCSSLKDDAGTTLASIRIDNQTDAAAAIDVIKAAINQVSDVRGTLGATQNRLDHTINNLSVMTENIQDAEATIRDVDIAEEMMAYTKNNILVQSAQAMLAQANQIPQGVLQLLG